ncbi:flagellar motor protein MotB [Oceanobacillus caeni]|uniref:Flagellar motor protein MotS n=1 Tax=Oceanobacillus caeni TaxID=405946 RepID=A0ABR5MLB0_9BACI|nr:MULTISPECIES: flagellar motor protein MotS [Bacillaceae]KKE77669.1 flagellar motor protein MotS [Bacilli bacterium VT-13-104]PZD83228.1 flagellar motor protein MotS [Bacilli bacterium]KPH76777.1 flagellar motor protein MotS [Oceanobacillus caeni]MBU8792273.1 flagellar motor protein MotB [Oceanobacillus caeni]MCR1834234.1 flagellar motor protein MotB [Oceanobacillus caeni]
MKRRRKRKSIKETGAPKWMVTYSDMVTLILVFFILLFAMSNLDDERFEAVQESFQNRMIFDFYPSIVPSNQPAEQSKNEKGDNLEGKLNSDLDESDLSDQTPKTEEGNSLDNLVSEVESFLDNNNLNGAITAKRSDEGVVLVLQENILFDTGEATVLNSAKPFLDKIGLLLKDVPNQVRVEGHTDSRPITNYRYPSNWELSAARAGSVIRYLTNGFELDEKRFSSVGYADTRPIAPNDSEKHWGKNRRVEIVIME